MPDPTQLTIDGREETPAPRDARPVAALPAKPALSLFAAPQTMRGQLAMPTNTASSTIRTTCGKCGGTGRYDAPTCYPGGCFACKGRGYHVRTAAAIARHNRKEAAREAEAATHRAASVAVVDRLMAAWAGEFAHIDPEHRHVHCTEKARRILAHDHGIHVRYTSDLADHLERLGVA